MDEIEINKLHVKGIERTNKEFLKVLIHPIFECKSLGNLKEAVSILERKLISFDMIKSPLQVSISLPDSGSGLVNLVDITFTIKEKKLVMKSGMEWAQNELSMCHTLTLNSPLGKGEKLEASIDMGISSNSPFKIIFSKHLFYCDNFLFTTSLSSSNFYRESNHIKENFPLSHQSSFSYTSGKIAGSISFGSLDRHLKCSWEQNPLSSFKSFFQLLLKFDTRDDLILPSSGFLFSPSFQLNFCEKYDQFTLKNELQTQIHFQLIKDFLGISIFGKTGVIFPSIYNTKINFLDDKFYLGGPTSIRLFPIRSIGPHIYLPEIGSQIPTGGNYFASLNLSLLFPILPQLSHILRGSVWANLGYLADNNSNYGSGFSYGIGIIWKILNIARLEVNLGWKFDRRQFNFVSPTFGISAEAF